MFAASFNATDVGEVRNYKGLLLAISPPGDIVPFFHIHGTPLEREQMLRKLADAEGFVVIPRGAAEVLAHPSTIVADHPDFSTAASLSDLTSALAFGRAEVSA